MSVPSTLDDRYGTAGRGRTRVVVVGAVLVAAAFLGWLAWAGWAHATPQVQSQLLSFSVADDHTVDAVVRVDLADGVEARCLVSALAEDHQTVGELSFVPSDGDNQVRIRTERRATAVRLTGCTGPDQPRPR